MDENNKLLEQPFIYLINIEDEIKNKLVSLKFNCKNTFIDSYLELPNIKQYDETCININQEIISNLHEYDIVVLDLTDNNITPFTCDYELKENIGLYTAFPKKMIDLQPVALHILNKQIEELVKKESILITFYSNYREEKYSICDYDIDGRSRIIESLDINNMCFYDNGIRVIAKAGKKITINENIKNSIMRDFLERNKGQISYKSVFAPPYHNDHNGDKNFYDITPLIYNEIGEIVSYYHFYKESAHIFLFPEIENKAQFIYTLITEVLPNICPTLFPNHGQFNWLNNSDYLVPEQKQLDTEKLTVEKKYIAKIAKINEKIRLNYQKYQFIHNLLTETDQSLVLAIKQFLEWLEFESVIIMDELQENLLEEDLQVESPKGLLIIEAKGIGGTSKDRDCNQVSKIRNRRMKEKQRFDVHGLYIVNHQRYIDPKQRKNPPFTKEQIDDAINDDRGLLTTYELYKSYSLIEQGLLTKKQVRDKLFNYGLITLEPELISLGKPKELFQKGKIVIIDLQSSIHLSIGDNIFFKNEHNDIVKTTICSLQLNEVEKNSIVGNGDEVGIKLDLTIKNNTELFIKP